MSKETDEKRYNGLLKENLLIIDLIKTKLENDNHFDKSHEAGNRQSHLNNALNDALRKVK